MPGAVSRAVASASDIAGQLAGRAMIGSLAKGVSPDAFSEYRVWRFVRREQGYS
jgi:hypothetical protein